MAMALAIAIGIASGLLANWAGVPLPWMLGPMVGNTIAALAGARIGAPTPLRPFTIPVIGVMLGSGLSSEVLLGALHWWPSLIMLVPFLMVSGLVSYQFYRRLGRFDPVTAFFASMPGGLNDMVILGSAAGGDEKRIALAHATRILVVIVFVVLFFGVYLGVTSNGQSRPYVGLGVLSATDAFWLVLCAVVGWPIAKFLRLPAPAMLGPMILSGAAHVAGVVEVPPPSILIICAQIILGTIIGCRFVGSSLNLIGKDMLLGAGSSLLMLGVATGFAVFVANFSGSDISQIFLAYSPGGLTEMSLLALAMGQEVAFVSISHMARITLVIFGAPLVFPYLQSRD